MLRDLEKHLIALGINPVDVVELGRGKQLKANQMMLDELGYDLPVQNLFLRFFDVKAAWDFPVDVARDEFAARMQHALKAGLRGSQTSAELYVDPHGAAAK